MNSKIWWLFLGLLLFLLIEWGVHRLFHGEYIPNSAQHADTEQRRNKFWNPVTLAFANFWDWVERVTGRR